MGNCTRKLVTSPKPYVAILKTWYVNEDNDQTPKLSETEDEYDNWGSNQSSLNQEHKIEESKEVNINNWNPPETVKNSSNETVPQKLGTDSSFSKKVASFDSLKADHKPSEALIVFKLDGLSVDPEKDEAGDGPRSSQTAISAKPLMLSVPPQSPVKESKAKMEKPKMSNKRQSERFSVPVFPIENQAIRFNDEDSEISNSDEERYMSMEDGDHESKNKQIKPSAPPLSFDFSSERTEVIPEDSILHSEDYLCLELSFDNYLDEDEDGGGYLGSFDRDIQVDCISGIHSASELIDFSGSSEPDLGDKLSFSSFLITENSNEKNCDRSNLEYGTNLSIRLGSDNCELVREPIDRLAGVSDLTQEDSSTAIVVDFQNQGPPASIYRTESSMSSRSLLRTPRIARMSLSCIDLDDSSDDRVSGEALISKTSIIPKKKVKKPDSRRFLGLQSPIDQWKHYEDPLNEFWAPYENSENTECLHFKNPIGNIIEHVLVEEEEWDRMFGIYSSTIGKHRDWIHGLDLDPTENYVVSGGNDNLIHVWDLKDSIGKTSKALSSLSASDAVSSVLFLTPEQIVIGTQSEMIVWNWKKDPAEFVNYFDRPAVMCLAKIPNQADLFLAGQEGGELAIWNVNRRKPVLDFDGTSKVTGVTTVSNGNVLVSCSRDSTINFWDQRTGMSITTFQAVTDMKQLKWVNGLCALNDHTIATARADNTIKIWDRRKNPLTACVSTLNGHENYVWDVKAVGDSGLISASSDSKLKLWDWKRGLEKQDLKGSKRTVFSMATNGEDKLFSAGMDHVVRSWTFWI